MSCVGNTGDIIYYVGGTCELGIVVELVSDADDSPSNIAVFVLFFDCICSRGTYVFVYFD